MLFNLIIGAGELGSRHLQGLLKIKQEQKIYLLDPLEESLKKANERSKEVDHATELIFSKNWNHIPTNLDLVIISTSSNIRAEVINKLLNQCTVRFLILEKVLFQDLRSYTTIKKLLSDKNIPTWVNHTRRLNNQYQLIKKQLEKSKCISFNVYGGSWGMACNGLHFIDLFSFLSNSIANDIDFSKIDQVINSKRAGFKEFTGTISGIMENGSSFTLQSYNEFNNDITITIMTPNHRWIITEGVRKRIIHQDIESNIDNIIDFDISYQSTLTTTVAEELFAGQDILLPNYQEALSSHFLFIKAGITRYNELTGENTDKLPIT